MQHRAFKFIAFLNQIRQTQKILANVFFFCWIFNKAQTIANFYLAFEAGLQIIPVINKIDLKTAKVDMVVEQIEKTLDFSRDDILMISAKHGTNCESVLEHIIKRLPW
jgi:translation elongation factor EF-4